MSCYGSTLAHLFTVNSISKLRTPLLASAVMGDTTAAFQFALSNICCWPRRAGRTITTEREAATATKSTFNDTELLHEPKKHIQYRWKGMNKKRRKKDRGPRDVEPCVRLASWSCRPCSRAALIGVVRPEHFHWRLLFSLSFCFHRLLDGWEVCTRCFAGPVVDLHRLVV